MDRLLSSLRLGASSKTVALADVSVADLMSGLSDEQKAGLAAELAPEPPKADDPAGGGQADDKTGGGEAEQPKGDAADPAHAQYVHGFAAAVERNRTVFASEHFAGRETAAAALLGNGKLSADEITATLASLPKGQGADGMLNALKGTENPNLGAGASSEGDGKKEAEASWDRTFAALGWAGDKTTN